MKQVKRFTPLILFVLFSFIYTSNWNQHRFAFDSVWYVSLAKAYPDKFDTAFTPDDPRPSSDFFHPRHLTYNYLGYIFNSLGVTKTPYQAMQIPAALFGAGSIALLYVLLRRSKVEYLASVFLATLFGVTHVMFLQSTVVEVNTQAVFFTLLSLFVYRNLLKKRSYDNYVQLILLQFLMFTAHVLTLPLILLQYAYLVFATKKLQWRAFLKPTIAFLVFLSAIFVAYRVAGHFYWERYTTNDMLGKIHHPQTPTRVEYANFFDAGGSILASNGYGVTKSESTTSLIIIGAINLAVLGFVLIKSYRERGFTLFIALSLLFYVALLWIYETLYTKGIWPKLHLTNLALIIYVWGVFYKEVSTKWREEIKFFLALIFGLITAVLFFKNVNMYKGQPVDNFLDIATHVNENFIDVPVMIPTKNRELYSKIYAMLDAKDVYISTDNFLRWS